MPVGTQNWPASEPNEVVPMLPSGLPLLSKIRTEAVLIWVT